jgi:leukotriene-A4 hydrolase
MSAVRENEKTKAENEIGSSDTKEYSFIQKIPIPAYLIAIAVGKIESRRIGPRSHVWSEKELVDKAAWEFEETEKIIQAAEQLMGPYVWGIYDLLVLPPSFPYGGMENPCLSFLTPTLIAGDRSLVSVVAHGT